MLTSLKKFVSEEAQRTGVYAYVRRRKFFAFCVGAPKTGTQSLADIFEDRYRSAHEPLWADTMEIVRAACRGEHTPAEWRAILRRRDREMHLEMESSHFMVLWAELLPDVFPKARYILTIREPRGWLDSAINQDLNYPAHRLAVRRARPVDLFWRDVQDHYYRPELPFHPAEKVLQDRRLPYSIEGYLSHWIRHNRRILDNIPEDRLLIVKTQEIAQNAHRMARFVGVDPATVKVERSHAHKAPRKHRLLEQVDPAFLEDRLAQCDATWRELLAREAAQPEIPGR